MNKYCVSCYDVVCEPYIKCAQCGGSSVLLCLNCFAVGWENSKHRNHHCYEVIKNDFAVFSEHWTAAEELRLLDGISVAGYGNWSEISSHVITKSRRQCRQHYQQFYLDKPHPLFPSVSMPDVDYFHCSLPCSMFGSDGDGSLEEESGGYCAPRGDFTVEHNDHAELNLKDIDLTKAIDSLDFDVQMAALRVYCDVLKERQRRKLIVRRYGLINMNNNIAHHIQFERSLGSSGFKSLKSLSQVLSPIQWDAYLQGLHWEKKLRQRILTLQYYRKLGLRTLRAASVYERLMMRRKRTKTELHLLSDILYHVQTENCPVQNQRGATQAVVGSLLEGIDRVHLPKKIRQPKDYSIFPGYSKLSESEQELCSNIRMTPEVYLGYRRQLVDWYRMHGEELKLVTARSLCRIDVNKTRKIYDLLIKEGVINYSNDS